MIFFSLSLLAWVIYNSKIPITLKIKLNDNKLEVGRSKGDYTNEVTACTL